MLVVMLDTRWLQSDVSNNDNNNNSNNNNHHHDHHHRTERGNLTVFAISSLHCELSATHTLKWPRHSRVQITCNTLVTHHVQHIGHSSCVTHWALIMCNTLGTHHVQHIGHSSCATHWALIMCNTLGTHHVQHIGHSSCATH